MPSTITEFKTRVSRIRTVTTYTAAAGLSNVVTVTPQEALPITLYRAKAWVNTPGFKALLLSKSPLPNNPFDNYGYSLHGNASTMRLPQSPVPGGWRQTEYQWFGPVASVSASDQGLANRSFNTLNSKLLAKAKGNQWNVPVFIAEGRETISMVTTAATRIVQMANALRQGKLKDFARYAHPTAQLRLADGSLRKRFGRKYARDPNQAFTSYWLELSYGWIPFLSDTHNAVNTLMDTATRPDSSIGFVRASHRQFITSTGPTTTLYNSDGIRVLGRVDRQLVYRQKAQWQFEVLAADIPGRFGLVNPLEVAWELVPLSFVADWFLPIGDYLSSLDAKYRFKHRGGTYGEKFTLDAQTVPTSFPAGAVVTGFNGTFSSLRVKRTPMAVIPTLSLLEMRFDAQLGAWRSTSAIALLYTFFGKYR